MDEDEWEEEVNIDKDLMMYIISIEERSGAPLTQALFVFNGPVTS